MNISEQPADVVPPLDPPDEPQAGGDQPPLQPAVVNVDPQVERLANLRIIALPRSEALTNKGFFCSQTSPYPQYWPRTFAILLAIGSLFRLFVAALDFILVVFIIVMSFENKFVADPVSSARIVFSFLIPSIVVGCVLGFSGVLKDSHADNDDEKTAMGIVILVMIIIISIAYKLCVFAIFSWTVVECVKWLWNNWDVPYSPKQLLDLKVSAQALARFEALTSSWPLWVVSNVWLQTLLLQRLVVQKNSAVTAWEVLLGIRVFVGAITFALDVRDMKPWRLYLVEKLVSMPICPECSHVMMDVHKTENSNLKQPMMRPLCHVCESDQDDIWYQCFHEGNHVFVCNTCLEKKDDENRFADEPRLTMFLFEVEKNLIGSIVLNCGCCGSPNMEYASRFFPLLIDIVMLGFYMPTSRASSDVMAATSSVADHFRMNLMESEAMCYLLVAFGVFLLLLLAVEWLSPNVVRKRDFVYLVKCLAVCYELLFWWMILVIIVHWDFIWSQETVLPKIGLVYFCGRWGWWVLCVIWNIVKSGFFTN